MKTTINSNAMFFHGKTLDGYKFTAAGINQGSKILVGISLCGENDIFCKSMGRTISSGRALNQRCTDRGRISLKTPSSVDNLFQYFTEEMAKYNNYSKKDILIKFGLYHKNEHKKRFIIPVGKLSPRKAKNILKGLLKKQNISTDEYFVEHPSQIVDD